MTHTAQAEAFSFPLFSFPRPPFFLPVSFTLPAGITNSWIGRVLRDRRRVPTNGSFHPTFTLDGVSQSPGRRRNPCRKWAFRGPPIDTLVALVSRLTSPSETVIFPPTDSDAIRTTRGAGMYPRHTSITLPVAAVPRRETSPGLSAS
jgi:hypothetical protein